MNTLTQKKINSRAKGSRGELELSKFLTDHGFPARRGQQFQGSPDSPDIVCDSLKQYHIECKRVERGNPYLWIEQANKDKGEFQSPVVMHRRSDKPWLAILYLEDLLELLGNYYAKN